MKPPRQRVEAQSQEIKKGRNFLAFPRIVGRPRKEPVPPAPPRHFSTKNKHPSPFLPKPVDAQPRRGFFNGRLFRLFGGTRPPEPLKL